MFVSLMMKGRGGYGTDKDLLFLNLSLYFCKLETFFKLAMKLIGELADSAMNT